jgi:predicted site-specific integrase-resolvase
MENEESLLQRKEIAKMMRISLVTLNDWVKRGLPSHKQRGKVYILHSEVMKYIKQNKWKKTLEIQ